MDLRGGTQTQSRHPGPHPGDQTAPMSLQRTTTSGYTHQLLDVVARENQLPQVGQRLLQILPDTTAHTRNTHMGHTHGTAFKHGSCASASRTSRGNSPDPVAVHQQGFQPSEERETVQFPDFVIREVQRVELVQSSPQVFYHWNFITWEQTKRRASFKTVTSASVAS